MILSNKSYYQTYQLNFLTIFDWSLELLELWKVFIEILGSNKKRWVVVDVEGYEIRFKF